MRRGLGLQVPSVLHDLQYLKSASSINIISLRLRSSSIRHIPNIPNNLTCTRPFSSTGYQKSQILLPVPSKPHTKLSEPSNPSVNIEPTTTSASENENKSITEKCFYYIHKESYHELLPYLIQHKPKVTPNQLESIFKELEIRKKYQVSIDIHKKFPAKSFKNEQVIKTLLRITFNAGEYSLFEIIFSKYLETANHSVRYCNMALKAFSKNRNLEFTKQLLYQMVKSHLPMNPSSFENFIKSVNYSGTFQSVKFAVDLLKQDPEIVVNGNTYSEIIEYYVRSATSQEIEEFTKFLETRNHDLYEIEVYQFLKNLTYERVLDYEQVWEKIDKIREKLEGKARFQEIFYKKLANIFVEKKRLQDLLKTLDYLAEDDIKMNDYIHSRIHIYFVRTGDIEGLMSYFKLLKQQKVHIEPIHVNTLWKTLIKMEPDLIEAITKTFQAFFPKLYTNEELNSRFLRNICLREARRSNDNKRPVIPDEYLSNSLNHLKDLIDQKKDTEIIAMINNELRLGLKPSFHLLIAALHGLVKMRSTESEVLYRLCCKMDKDNLIEYDLAWLKKSVFEVLDKSEFGRQIEEAGTSLVQDFRLKHQGQMSHRNLNDLANISLSVHNEELAMGILQDSKNSDVEIEQRDETKLFTTLAMACARTRDIDFYFKALDTIIYEPNLKINKHLIKQIQGHKYYFSKKSKVNRLIMSDPMDIDEQLKGRVDALKQKYKTQKEDSKKLCLKCLNFLEDWNKST